MSKQFLRLLSTILLLAVVLSACATPATPAPPTSAPATTAPITEAKPTQPPAPTAVPTQAPKPTEVPAPAPTAVPEVTGTLMVACEQQATWVRNFNPFANGRILTRNGIYEPLMIFNSTTSELIPWLATAYRWESDGLKLVLDIREGVLWSDGTPFSAEDVAFTFNLILKDSALSAPSGLRQYVAAVKALDAKTVEFILKSKYTPLVYDLVTQNILPKHIWETVSEPAKYTNENPVGTGPFTEIIEFKEQVYELGRNPNYWQPGKPAFKSIRCPALPGNEQTQLALINDEIDWASISIPDVEQTFVAKSPNYGYWFPTTGSDWMLYLNTTRKPFDNLKVRQAISMAIDREQIAAVPMFGYTKPADATGLSDGYAQWKNPEAVAAGEKYMTYDPAAANALLDEVGLVKNNAGLRTLDGKPLKFEVIMISGWSDTVAASEIIVQNLAELGFQAELKTGDWGFWTGKILKGDYDISMGWSSGGPTPLNFYQDQFSSTSYRPVGETSWANWARYVSSEADTLIATFVSTTDPDVQKAVMDSLQMAFVKELPAIPLYPGPGWYEYSTKNFTGWPTAENPYAEGMFAEPERLIILTTITPK